MSSTGLGLANENALSDLFGTIAHLISIVIGVISIFFGRKILNPKVNEKFSHLPLRIQFVHFLFAGCFLKFSSVLIMSTLSGFIHSIFGVGIEYWLLAMMSIVLFVVFVTGSILKPALLEVVLSGVSAMSFVTFVFSWGPNGIIRQALARFVLIYLAAIPSALLGCSASRETVLGLSTSVLGSIWIGYIVDSKLGLGFSSAFSQIVSGESDYVITGGHLAISLTCSILMFIGFLVQFEENCFPDEKLDKVPSHTSIVASRTV